MTVCFLSEQKRSTIHRSRTTCCSTRPSEPCSPALLCSTRRPSLSRPFPFPASAAAPSRTKRRTRCRSPCWIPAERTVSRGWRKCRRGGRANAGKANRDVKELPWNHFCLYSWHSNFILFLISFCCLVTHIILTSLNYIQNKKYTRLPQNSRLF